MRTVMRCVCGACLLSFAMTAAAVQLGDPQGSLTIDQSIDAYIQILADPAASTAAVTLTQLAPTGTGGTSSGASTALHGDVVRDASGTYIRVTSASAIAAPTLRFRLNYATAGMALTRNYEVALARPRAVAATRPRRVVTPEGAASGGASYGPVQPGETLWDIARTVNLPQAGSLREVMDRLLADNPDAFIAGDMNRLKAGATLVVASATTVATARADDVPAPRTPPSAPRQDEVIATATGGRDPEVRPAPVTLVQQPERRSIDWRVLNPEHDAELRRLDEKFARIRARYAGMAQVAPTSTTADAEAAEVPEQAPDTASAARVTPAAAEIQVALSPVAAAVASTAFAAPQAGSAADAPTFAALRLIVTMSVGGLILGALGFRFTRRKAQTVQRQEHQQHESARKERVAHKAAQRLELEAEIKRIMEEHRRSKPAVEPVEGYDDMTEVDLSITHGRYQRAELLLKDVLREAPRNVDAKLRLADVYYVTEQAKSFLRMAQDLRAHHRHDMADDDWQRVVRMGRVLCPDDSLFGRLSGVTGERISA